MTSVKERAFAKINLFLEVTGKLENGFHELKTVMHSVTLFDDVTVSYSPSRSTEVHIEIEGNKRLPHDARNLAVRAAELFMERSCKQGIIYIKMVKRIPIAAGLAGGSSDAAATLRAMNRIFDGCFTERMLLSMAAELGSDVPYCLVGGTALCRGRGEIITKLPDPKPENFVIAIASERVSTPSAFAELDRAYSDFDGTKPLLGSPYFSRLDAGISDGVIASDGLYNNFEEVILPGCPGAARIKERMLALGAVGALMSGSGPSVYGIFESREAAESSAKALSGEGVEAFAVCSARR